MVAILNSVILDSSTLQQKITLLIYSHSCDNGSHLEFSHLRLSHFAQNKLYSFILTQHDDGSHLEFGHLGFSHLEFGHLGFSNHSISSQTHSHLPRLVPTICTKKLHSFILTQLDDGSHLEFCHVEFRHYPFGFRHLVIFSQNHSKNSHSTLTLTQTNSIRLKLNHSHLTWWWWPSWILPSWIWPSWIQPS